MIGQSYLPLGFVTFAVGGTVGGLTGTTGSLIIPAKANRVLLQCETTNLRWRDDGGPLASGVGMLLVAGGTPFEYSGNLSKIQFLSTGANGVLNGMYYLDVG